MIAEFNCAPERERGLVRFLKIDCFEGAIALLKSILINQTKLS
jgi:hypothetical protein